MNMSNGTGFWFGYNIPNFLFKNYNIDSIVDLITVCIVTAILVVLYESMKARRIIARLNVNDSTASREDTVEESGLLNQSTCPYAFRRYRSLHKFLDIVEYFIETVLGYVLMLIAMTYNAYLMLSILLGSMIGYMLYGSTMLNVTAQAVANRLCKGCTLPSNNDGESTPVLDSVDRPSTSAILVEEERIGTTTVSVHCS